MSRFRSYRQAGSGLCDATQKPSVIQACGASLCSVRPNFPYLITSAWHADCLCTCKGSRNNNNMHSEHYRPIAAFYLQIEQSKPILTFTAWEACEATCGSGFADRVAYCTDGSGDITDVSSCSGFKGILSLSFRK